MTDELARIVLELEAELDHVRLSHYPDWHAVDNLVDDLKEHLKNRGYM